MLEKYNLSCFIWASNGLAPISAYDLGIIRLNKDRTFTVYAEKFRAATHNVE